MSATNQTKSIHHLVRALQNRYDLTIGEAAIVVAVIDRTVNTLRLNSEDNDSDFLTTDHDLTKLNNRIEGDHNAKS